jgi:hypothetical protein
MSSNSGFKPAWARKSSVRTDLPLLVVPRADKRKVGDMISPGQLVCVGTVYMKTHRGLIKIKAA